MGLLMLSFPKEVDNLSEENGFEEKQTNKQTKNTVILRMFGSLFAVWTVGSWEQVVKRMRVKDIVP